MEKTERNHCRAICDKQRKMKISTKGRYALRMMIDIAVNDHGEPVRIKEIAGRQGISDKYLEQIISVLNKAGYVKSIRGPQGGYRLTKAPADYTVGSILRLIEGSLAPVSCLESDVNECERQQDCATLILWQKLNNAINNVIDNITIENLIEWQQGQNGNYVI